MKGSRLWGFRQKDYLSLLRDIFRCYIVGFVREGGSWGVGTEGTFGRLREPWGVVGSIREAWVSITPP